MVKERESEMIQAKKDKLEAAKQARIDKVRSVKWNPIRPQVS